MHRLIQEVFYRIPYPLLHLGYRASILLGRTTPAAQSWKIYHTTSNQIKKTWHWDRHTWEKYQIKTLRELLTHCAGHVPYYQELFSEERIHTEQFKNINDLAQLPILTKNIIRSRQQDFISDTYPPESLTTASTSGTTGQPFSFFYPAIEAPAIETAFIASVWRLVGHHPGDRVAIIRCHRIGTAGTRQFSELQNRNRWLVLSSFHMTRNTIPAYYSRIEAFHPRFLYAYPSSATVLASYIKEQGLPPFSGIRAVLLSSEQIFAWQRALIEEVFGCRVFSWYGNSEQTVLARECELSSLYHVYPQYGILEILDEQTYQPLQAGTYGEIVTTGFVNQAFPLIRYDTEDQGSFYPGTCPCGRDHLLLNPSIGRNQDYLVGKEGERIPLRALIFSHTILAGISRMQFRQKRPGAVELDIIANRAQERETMRKMITQTLYRSFQGRITFTVNFVESIAPTKRGKIPYLKQQLANERACDHNE